MSTVSNTLQVDIKMRRSNCTIVNKEKGIDSFSSLGTLLFRKLSISGAQAIRSESTPACVETHRIALIDRCAPEEQSDLFASEMVTKTSAN